MASPSERNMKALYEIRDGTCFAFFSIQPPIRAGCGNDIIVKIGESDPVDSTTPENVMTVIIWYPYGGVVA